MKLVKKHMAGWKIEKSGFLLTLIIMLISLSVDKLPVSNATSKSSKPVKSEAKPFISLPV